jgi:hypothetical protein
MVHEISNEEQLRAISTFKDAQERNLLGDVHGGVYGKRSEAET